ncbi:MAG: hypothetical protein IIZ09_09755 [Ruminococcus sp.]|nr:hypothetical protein [Ruminococcus sp.]
MDSFKEQIIKKQKTSRDSMMKTIYIIGTVVLASLVMLIGLTMTFMLPIGFIIAALIIYGGYRLIQGLDLEYEYIFTNGELDVDKVIAAKSRKNLVTVNIGDTTDIGEFSGEDSGSKTVVMASACDSDRQDYFIDFKHSEYGDTRVIFTPDNDMLCAIKTYLPRQIRNKLNVKAAPAEDID